MNSGKPDLESFEEKQEWMFVTRRHWSLRAGDLAYAHFMSECPGFTDGDTIPIRPRLMEDLKRIGKCAKKPSTRC